jgi:hypothetical protein
MDTKQVLELLRKELRGVREASEKRADDRFEAWREKMAAMREELVANMGTSHMEMVSKFKLEIEEKMMACREAMEARLEEEKPVSVYTKPAAAQQEEVVIVIPVGEPEEKTTSITRKETMACQEMEARMEEKEPTSVDRKPEVAQQREVPNEDAVMKPVKGRKKRN